MKKILLVLGLALIFNPVLQTQATTIVQKDMGYISVNTSESMEIIPNIATVNFSVETTDVDSKRATEINNKISAKVINALKQELTSDKKSYVQTKNFNLRPNYKKNTEKDVMVIKNYTAINTIQVKTSDLTKISTLIDTAIKNNVSNVSGITMSAEEYDQYTNELLQKTIFKAKTMAQDTASALNQKVCGIKNIRVNTYQQASNGMRLYKTMSMDSVEENSASTTTTPIEAGKIKINVSIDAQFYVE